MQHLTCLLLLVGKGNRFYSHDGRNKNVQTMLRFFCRQLHLSQVDILSSDYLQRVVIRFVVAVYVEIILSCWFMSRTPRVLIISDGYCPFCWIFLMHLNFFFVESFHIIVAKLFLQECWLRHARFMFGTSSNIRRIFPVIIFVLIHDIRAQFLSIRIDFE